MNKVVSTPNRDGLFPEADSPCGKQFVVEKGRTAESLADYVRRVRNEKRLSLADVSERSGHLIGRTHINRIENGEVVGVSVEKVRALAKGLGIPEEEIFAIARGRSAAGDLNPEEWRIVHYYRSIPFERQLDLLSYSEMLFTRYGNQSDPVSNGGPKAGKVYDAVAGIPKAVGDKKKRAGKSSEKK
jgi:transcriptional regulator with XRE-family HTH domain